MKRGFLNKKNKRGPPSGDNGASTPAISPSTTVVACPKTLSEPVVGQKFIGNLRGTTFEPYAVARIPPATLTQSKEPSTTCIMRHSTVLKITNTPGFYTPPPADPTTTAVSQKNTPTMGIGLFAKRAFAVHQLVFSERPLLIFPRGLHYSYGDGMSEADIAKQHDALFEEHMRQALGVMPKEDVDAFMGLSNCMPDCPPLQGIARTNAFGTSGDIEEENLQEGKTPYATVGRLASRINHDCSPNVYVKFDIPTFSLQVLALRDIKPGQQLVYSYCQPHRGVKERQRQLATYGFECKCRACATATPATDTLREEMDERIQKLFDEVDGMLADPQFSVRSLDPLLEYEKALESEELDFGDKFSLLVYVILRGYHKLKNRPKHIEYFNKGKRLTGETN